MPQYRFNLDAIRSLPAGEQAQALAALRRFRDRRDFNPLEVFTPYDLQAELMRSRARVRAFLAGNRAGKTTMGVVDDLLEVTPRELVPAHLQEFKRAEWECPRYIRCVANSNKLINSVFVAKFREWTPRQILKGGRFGDSYEKANMVLRLECGCMVEFLSNEMDLDKHGGSARHRCHYDEEPPEEYRDEGRARLTDFDGTELFTMTPLQGMSWMYDGIWYRSERDPKVKVVTASLVDNPFLSPAGVKATIEEYADRPEQFAARIHGQFIHFGGMVYPTWREWVGEAMPQEHIKACDIIVGVDPGVLGFGLVAVAFDGFDNALVFWAKRLVDSDVEQAVKVLRSELCGRWGLNESDLMFVIDPSARSRSAISSATIQTEFENQGINLSHGQNEREAGVLQIRRRGRLKKLAISKHDAGDLLWELERYRIQDREDGRFDVVKRDDHCCDAFRYACMERPYDDDPQIILPGPNNDVCTGPPPRRPQESVMGHLA